MTEQLLEAGNRLERAFVVVAGRTVQTLNFGRLAHTYPFLLSLPQANTEEILISELAAKGIEIEWDTELMELTVDDDQVTAIIATEERVDYVTFDHLIGADGAFSTARHCARLGITSPYPDYGVCRCRYCLPAATRPVSRNDRDIPVRCRSLISARHPIWFTMLEHPPMSSSWSKQEDQAGRSYGRKIFTLHSAAQQSSTTDQYLLSVMRPMSIPL